MSTRIMGRRQCESAKLLRSSEREVTERKSVRRLHACNSFVCKFVAREDLRGFRASTASRIFKEQTVETDHPQREDE